MKLGNIACMTFLCAIVTSGFASFSQADVVDAAGEVFLKGSVDGKRMFLVLGVQDGLEKLQDIKKWAIDIKDLNTLENSLYSPSSDDKGLNGALNTGVQEASTLASKAFSAPWRSLQEIPNSFRVNMESANEAYYKSDSAGAGNLKYGAWATWAYIKGGYYLVIEAPAEAVGYTVGALGVTPYHVALQTLSISYNAVKILFKFNVGAIAGAAVGTYSTMTSTGATLLSMVAGGAVAAYQGGKWLMYGFPRSFLYPIKVTRSTAYTMDQVERVGLAYREYFSKFREYEVDTQIDQYTSTITLKASRPGKDQKSVFVIFYISPENGVLKIEAEVRGKFYTPRTKEVKLKLEKQIKNWMNEVDELLKPTK